MRILSFVSGIAVLFTTLAFAHFIYHVLTVPVRGENPSAGYWLGVGCACLVGILSLIGGCLLIRRAR
jgi:ABC-type antimicrobial peptide transport system permease subunit